MPIALVRRPGPRLVDGLVTHIERTPVDLVRAHAEWAAYGDAFRAAGWTVQEVPPADECPDAVFVEDALVVLGDVAVCTRPGAPTRRAEVGGAAAAARAAGLRTVAIEAPATLDGGDVLKAGRTLYVGLGARTNSAGIEQLRAIAGPLGWTVAAVPITRVLHLKSACTALPDGTLVGWLPAIDDPALLPGLVAMPEESGAHVVDLGGGTVLMADDCPRSAALVRARGFAVVTVGIGEFVRLEGCVTCLSVRLRDR